MNEREFRIERFTRREFREALGERKFKSAIIATGSIEQHLEHLALVQDNASCQYIAQRVCEAMYPSIVLAVPINIGIAEHHMEHPGTLTTSPGAWLAVVYDAIDSLVRHGIKKVQILNGHGGNKRPVYGVIGQWQQKLHHMYGKDVDVRFNNYWDVLTKDFVSGVQKTPGFPSHAREFETAFTMAIYPENVRVAAIPFSKDEGAASATAETGRKLVEKIVEGVTVIMEDLQQGRPQRFGVAGDLAAGEKR
ncbi:MAG: creatininase family protein [SAR202 cluster bacterium]|nr:creatininase family protein [SAR202 cluster bacterium]